MELADILGILREHAEELRERFSVKRIAVFGSYAKGSFNDASDVDVYVEFDLSSVTYDKYIELISYLESLLGKKVDLITKEGLRSIRISDIRDDIVKHLVYV